MLTTKGRLKKTVKCMTLCKKGDKSEKRECTYECMNKSHILLGEGGRAKVMSFFQDVFSSHHLPIFQLILLNFEVNFHYYFNSLKKDNKSEILQKSLKIWTF